MLQILLCILLHYYLLDLVNKRFVLIQAANLPNILTGTYNVNAAINYGITQIVSEQL
jgi:Na+(H+)/acetate symporter ActP